MAKLVYFNQVSLDEYYVDADGDFSWAVPPDDVHEYANELERATALHLMGRRMYEVMRYWDEPDDGSQVERDFAAAWAAADKVVYSSTLEVAGPRTTIARAFDADAVRRWKEASDRDLALAGVGLAAQALAAGLVDELSLVVYPVVVGGGRRYLPEGVRLGLELLEHREFSQGIVLLRYRVLPAPRPPEAQGS